MYLSFGSIYCDEHLEFGLVDVPQDEQSMPGYVQIQGNFIYFEVPDLDLDSALFINGFQDANKKEVFFPHFLLISFYRYICINLQR